MANEFGLAISGDRETILRFDRFPQAAHDRLLQALRSIEERLLGMVLAAEPSKGSTLRGQTGGSVYDHGDRIAAVVGPNVPKGDSVAAGKAAALEWGARKAFEVRAHQMGLDHVFNRLMQKRPVSVPAYTRTPNIPEFRYLRGPAEALRDEALAQMRAALDAAANDTDLKK